jgi:hypothetical protein
MATDADLSSTNHSKGNSGSAASGEAWHCGPSLRQGQERIQGFKWWWSGYGRKRGMQETENVPREQQRHLFMLNLNA